MQILEYYRQNRKAYGRKTALKKVFQRALQKLMGVDHLESRMNRQKEELDTLFYFLNEYADIKRVPPAGGSLRKFQENDVLLLRIVDTVCRQYGLSYWLAWGTLLGAVRHRGFIPWDDDLDVNMERKDYEKAKEIMSSVLTPFGFAIHIDPSPSFESIGIGYKDSGVWIDIIPVDCLRSDLSYSELNKDISVQFYEFGDTADTMQRNEIAKKVNTALSYHYAEGKNEYYAQCFMHGHKPAIYLFDADDLLPYHESAFENNSMMVPHCAETVCEVMYGNDYMKFPKSGVLHHVSKLPSDDVLRGRGLELERIIKQLIQSC